MTGENGGPYESSKNGRCGSMDGSATHPTRQAMYMGVSSSENGGSPRLLDGELVNGKINHRSIAG